MIPVSNGKIIDFLRWLENNNNNNIPLKSMDYYSIHRLALDFLQDNTRSAQPLSKRNIMQYLLMLYQTCPEGSSDAINRMEHFFNTSKWINYEKAINTKYLNIYLKDFITFTETLGYKKFLEAKIWDIVKDSRLHGDLTKEHFDKIKVEIGPQLKALFSIYCQYSIPDSYHNFNIFLNKLSEEHSDRETQAHGLTQAVNELIDGDNYDEILGGSRDVSDLFCYTVGLSEDLVQGITFIDWVKKKEPKVNLLGSIPVEKSEEWVREFCKERGYTNIPQFTREIRKLLNNEDTLSRALRRVKTYLNRKSPEYLQERNDLLERYESVSMHGMFVFDPKQNIRGFIENNWRQFNWILGENFDVYYSLDDLKARTGQSFEQYNYFDLNLEDLPVLILWEDSLNETTVFPFCGLDEHDDIAELFKNIIVAGVKKNESLSDILDRATMWKNHRIEERRLEKGGIKEVTVNNISGNSIVNQGEGKIIFKENVYQQQNLEKNEVNAFNEQDIKSLKEFVHKLKNLESEYLSEELALNGAATLSAIIKATEEKNEDERIKKISELKSWRNSIGEKGIKALALIADVVTVTVPTMQLLGLLKL